MSGRPVTRDDHEKFCTAEGWSEVRNAPGKAVRHHSTYELELPDGSVLRTRMSRPVDRTYGPSMWRHILTEQLHVEDDVFWALVKDNVLPRRSASVVAHEKSLPASLAWQLIHEAGVLPDQLAQMTRAEAIARMQEHWSGPG